MSIVSDDLETALVVVGSPGGDEDLGEFTMPFQPMVIEHLGLRLYSTLPPVISELVSNAYDAESSRVEITLPKGAITEGAEVVVRDYGHGMSASEIQDHYLPIARARRGEDGSKTLSKNGIRHVTGRKGLGKLAGFGVAREMDVRSICDGKAVAIRLNYDDMIAWAKKHPQGEPYRPEVLRSLCGPTSDPAGTQITLRAFRRKTAIDAPELRAGLARRLLLIDLDFKVIVQDEEVQPKDRVEKKSCDMVWDVSAFPPPGAQVASGFVVRGWCGFLTESSQANRGVNIYANRKAVELHSFFGYSGTDTQFARAYFVGEIHADKLDAEADLVATARNSVVWESPEGQEFQAWGQQSIRWLFKQWLKSRQKKKEAALIEAAGFEEWLATRTSQEKRRARRMVSLLVEDPEINEQQATPLLEIIKASVETVAYQDLLDEIEQSGATTATLLRLFSQWRVIEAREHLTVADGRQQVIRHLLDLIESDALEVQQMQKLLDENPWLINSGWKEVDRQATYTQKLRHFAAEPRTTEDKDRRIDIFALTAGNILNIVEIKRPGKTLSNEDLTQIESYVDWAAVNLVGTGDDAPVSVTGLLVVGKLNSNFSRKLARLRGDGILVQTWEDIRRRAQEYYSTIEDRLKTVAPEYLKYKKSAGALLTQAIEKEGR